MFIEILSIFALFNGILGAADVPTPVWEILPQGGIAASVPDQAGLSEVHLHFSINKEVPGVAAGDYNVMISAVGEGGQWRYEGPDVAVAVGDTVNYWILVIVNGEGFQATDLSYTFEQAGTTTTTEQTTTTAKPTTVTQSTSTTTTTEEPTTTTEDQSLPKVQLELVEPRGFKMWVDDVPGLMHVAFHININEELHGVDFGNINIDLTEPDASGQWLYQNDEELLDQMDDVVYYWYYLVIDKEGHQVTEQQWYPNGEPTTITNIPTEGTTSIPDQVSVTESSQGPWHLPGELIFEDNFEELSTSNWEHEITLAGGGNWEFQAYTHNRSNSYVRDGILYLKATLTSDVFGEQFLTSGLLDYWGGQPADRCTMASFYGCLRAGTGSNLVNPIMSARLRSAKAFTFVYGKVEVRAKMPVGDWLWPAIWMLPSQHIYGQWPASGEIDIVESRGNLELMKDGVNIGVEQAGSTLHYGGGYPMNGWPKAHVEKQNPSGWHSDFHTYQVNWTPDFIEFSIDDEVLGRVEPPVENGFWALGEWDQTEMDNPWRGARNKKMAPFDEQFFIVLNLAVGGTGYFPDEATNPGGKPWSNQSPTAAADFWNGKNQWLPTWHLDENNGEGAALQVDYVKVWASDVIKTE